MTKPTRQVLTIALVTAALCADRGVIAAPAPRVASSSVAGRLVSRLSVSLKRSIPSAQVYQTRHDEAVQSQARGCVFEPVVCLCDGSDLSPLLTRLPPPLL